MKSQDSTSLLTTSIIKALLRNVHKQRPLVSLHGRTDRRSSWRRYAVKLLFRQLKWALPSLAIKIKWRWLRGHIREERLVYIGFKRMALPLYRRIDYQNIASKLIDVQPFNDDHQLMPFIDNP